MKLIKCYIENFGLLHAQEFSFERGVNCCISDNSTGKTTLGAFIEAMLYGIGDTRRTTLDENPRKKYNPWQGGRFGGSLTFETGKKKYTIERSFGPKAAEDTYRLIDASTGKESLDYDENIGERLFGIDRDGFLRTVYLSEKNLQGKNENKSISAKLSDLVGVDGDVGGFDDALKLLEDRRKFYFKKGNTGEIANVKEQILECQRRLDELERIKVSSKENEANLKALKVELTHLSELEAAERAKLSDISKHHEKLSHEERYATMLSALNTEKQRLAAAAEFFKAGLPTLDDVDKARDAYLESERLKKEAYTDGDNEELARLRRFFARGTDFVEIAEMEREAILLTKKEVELSKLKEERDAASIEMKSIFPSRVPTEKELSSFGKAKKLSIPLILLCILSFVCAPIGLLIGGIGGYAVSAIGFICSIILAIIAFKPTKDKELLAFLREFDEDDTKDTEKALGNIRARLEKYNALRDSKNKEREILEDDISDLQRRIFPFLEKFPVTASASIIDALTRIKADYSRFYSLGEADSVREADKLSKASRSDELYRASMTFIAKYPTTGPDAFSEIRQRINDYNYLTVTVQRMQNDCDAYSVRYGVSGNASLVSEVNEVAINNALQEISAKREDISRRHALLERELRIAYDEIEKHDEIILLKESLEELHSKHVESLEVIKKTSLLLKEACNNMTAKYLGKTKTAFLEYSGAIAGIGGDYTISTDFEISRSDRGVQRSVESYSRGTRDMYALAMRFALIDALYEKESPFIILDDPFIALDDTKIERAKSLLKTMSKGKQILYFTCSKSREI